MSRINLNLVRLKNAHLRIHKNMNAMRSNIINFLNSDNRFLGLKAA